jgi:predicted NAD/FAD-dependent oxidoreductase
VAIIGAGIGGCFAAKFLRENGGEKLDIHVFAKKGSKIGGRTAVCQFDGHTYETGACVIHSANKYLVDAAKQHGEYATVPRL